MHYKTLVIKRKELNRAQGIDKKKSTRDLSALFFSTARKYLTDMII